MTLFRRAALFAAALLAAIPLAAAPPNVVMIISDDQHWGDYGFMGHPHIQTPHLDKLAAQSLTFKDRKSTRLNSSHSQQSRMPSSA